MSDRFDFTVVLEPQPEGGFTVSVPALPEVVTEGDSEAEGDGDGGRCHSPSSDVPARSWDPNTRRRATDSTENHRRRMSLSLPAVNARQVLAALRRAGFVGPGIRQSSCTWSTPMTLVVPLRSRSMVHEASRRELSAISPVRQVSPLMSFVVICDLSGDAQPPDVSRKVAYPAEKIRTGLTRQRRKRSQLEAYCLSVSAILPGLVVVGANYYWQARHSS